MLELSVANSICSLTLFRVTGGELFDLVIEAGQFPEVQAKDLFRQMLEATEYLHGQEIAHRDLKVRIN